MFDMFTLDKKYTYIIYGAAAAGKMICENLMYHGYSVHAFFDRQADKIQHACGLNVYDPERYEHRDFENTVVVISVRIPFEHEAIAAYLYKFGYDKIIYRPCSGNIPNFGELKISEENYNSLISGDITENAAFVKYFNQMDERRFVNNAVIHFGEDSVIVYIPTDICFTTTKKQLEREHLWHMMENIQQVTSRIDLPIYMGWYEVVHFFRACMGIEPATWTAVAAYEEWVRINPTTRWNLYPRDNDPIKSRILERLLVYNGLESVYLSGGKFFESHPISAEWNPRGYFNIVDGCHRVCFYIAKGISQIPAVMSKKDYDSWLHLKSLAKCFDFIKGKNMLAAYAPIPHPNFYQFPTYRDVGGYTRIQKISEFLCYNQIQLNNRNILDAGAYYCYLSQFFARLGANVTAIEYAPESHQFAKLLNELLYCSNINCICTGLDDFDLSQRFSITIMLTVLYPYMGSELGLTILKNIDIVTQDLLIWESGDQPQKEIQYILENSSFTNYMKLSETIGTAKIRELGVFYRDHIPLTKPYWCYESEP